MGALGRLLPDSSPDVLTLVEINEFICINYYGTSRMNSEIPRLEGDVKSPAGISKHQGEAQGYGSHGFQDFSGTDTYS